MQLTDGDGRELKRADLDEDGNAIDLRTNMRAGILGTILLLEQIVRHDTSHAFRREARVQADFLRALLRKRVGQDIDLIADLVPEVVQQLEGMRKQLPARQAPLVIENGSDS